MKQHVFLIALLLVALWACEKDENKLPTEPVLLLPANGSVVDLSKLEFDFSEGSDPENTYVSNILKVSEDSVSWYEVQTYANSFECELEFKEGQKYYWKVQCFEYDESANQVISGRMTESKVFHFYTNAPNVFELKAESSSHTNWTGHNFVKLSWLEPDNTDYVEVSFEPQVNSIQQPIQVPAGQGELLLEDFFDNWVPLKQEDAKVYTFEVKAVSTDGLPSVPDTIRAMPLDKLLVHDYDFNVYGTVMINNQVWLDRNLMTAHFNDGKPFSEGMSARRGKAIREYGYFYTLKRDYDPITHNPCPCGFHIPTHEEWKQLELAIGMPADKIDEWTAEFRGLDRSFVLKSTTGWLPGPNGEDYNGIDQYGFNMKPAGTLDYNSSTHLYDSKFDGVMTRFLTSTITPSSDYFYGRYVYENRGIGITNNYILCSIRCIRDN